LVEDRAAKEEWRAMTWALASAEARATAASFRIPLRAEREALCVGSFAKLVFVDPTKNLVVGERMWVEIMAADAGRYWGRLRNVPVVITGLEEDDLVEFGPEHVADWTEGGDR
jgi:uncharacterized protein YegJ (DUF2314 family)